MAHLRSSQVQTLPGDGWASAINDLVVQPGLRAINDPLAGTPQLRMGVNPPMPAYPSESPAGLLGPEPTYVVSMTGAGGGPTAGLAVVAVAIVAVLLVIAWV